MIATLDLKRALADPRRLARALGLPMQPGRRSPGVFVRCPWHDDRTPSCSLSPGSDGTLRVRCFGCGTTADTLTLIAKVRGLDVRRDFRAVAEEAARLGSLGLQWQRPRGVTPAESVPVAHTDVARGAVRAITKVLLQLGRLDDSVVAADACAYLDRRGLLGEARKHGCASLPPEDAQAAWCTLVRAVLDPNRLAMSGLLRRGEFAFARHRLLIPWRLPNGEIDTLQRRTLGGAREPRYVFPAGVGPRFPFGIDALSRAPRDAPIAFVEGALDVLAVRALFGSKHVERLPLGLPGASGWRREWATLAKGRDVFLAFDDDAAGERAAATVADDVERAGATRIFRAIPVGGKDWGEVLEARP